MATINNVLFTVQPILKINIDITLHIESTTNYIFYMIHSTTNQSDHPDYLLTNCEKDPPPVLSAHFQDVRTVKYIRGLDFLTEGR